MAASAVFFPLTSISPSLCDFKTAVPGLPTGSYTVWSIKPDIHELVVDLSKFSQCLAIAEFFKSYAIGHE